MHCTFYFQLGLSGLRSVLINMLIASLDISIIMKFWLWSRSLDVSHMKFFIVHGPGGFGLAYEVFWLITAKIRCYVATSRINVSKS